ncbi:MAB_1171c family putative transporter [Streptomyces sp. NPDC048045]|uniref:MAB_1171c family putative transporter n=1 Tax=Streptomyces sp. NPDC048045 TaxID=3154710 RepID=UPI00341F001F
MSLVVYSAACLFGMAALLLFHTPRVALRDPLTATTCAAIFLGGLCYFCSAPVTLDAVNDVTGIPNFGAPMTYSVISAYSASLLILLITWRGGPGDRIRCWSVRIAVVYSLLIAAIITMFALADAPVERLRDLDTYYANTPYMREMIVLYLAGHGACLLTMCYVCRRWSREVTGILRTGLRLIMLGLAFDVIGFEGAKSTAVVARWTGHDLDFLSTDLAPPVTSLGALICTAGFVLPRLLPAAQAQWRSLWDYRALAPLWAELQDVPTAPKPAPPRWQLPRGRLYYRELRILDALLALQSRCDGRIREAAYRQAVAQGSSPGEAGFVAAAAMVVDAAHQAGRLRPSGSPGPPGTSRLHTAVFSETGELVRLSQALATSPVVEAARGGVQGTA